MCVYVCVVCVCVCAWRNAVEISTLFKLGGVFIFLFFFRMLEDSLVSHPPTPPPCFPFWVSGTPEARFIRVDPHPTLLSCFPLWLTETPDGCFIHVDPHPTICFPVFPFGWQRHLMGASSMWIPTPPSAFLFSPLVDRDTWWVLHPCGSPPHHLLSCFPLWLTETPDGCFIRVDPHPTLLSCFPLWLTETPDGCFIRVDPHPTPSAFLTVFSFSWQEHLMHASSVWIPPPPPLSWLLPLLVDRIHLTGTSSMWIPPPAPHFAFLTVFSLGWLEHLMDDSSALIPLHPTFLTSFQFGLTGTSDGWFNHADPPPTPLPWLFPFGCFIRMDPHPSLPFLTFSPLVDRYTWCLLHLHGFPPSPAPSTFLFSLLVDITCWHFIHVDPPLHLPPLSWLFFLLGDRYTWCALHPCGDLHVHDQASPVFFLRGHAAETSVCCQLPRGSSQRLNPPLPNISHFGGLVWDLLQKIQI